MCSTPPHCVLWFNHSVRSFVGIWLSELRATFTIKVSCCVAIYFLMLVISEIFFLTVSFIMCLSFISAIPMPNMRRMLHCRNTSTFLGRISGVPIYHIPMVIS